ncbi:hypothetical protein [Stenotrophomonas sp.]|uniref:hypothetical protein n=1 Tax=Stenotrophomonas sp. TaxID=69392 RepID=UPI0031DA4FDD
MFKRIKAEWLLALSLALPGLAVGASAYVQEVGKEWAAFPYLPGQKTPGDWVDFIKEGGVK